MINIKEMIKKNEGVRYYAYKDTVGLWTCACGENLLRPGSKARLEQAGIDHAKVWAAIREAEALGKSRTIPVVTEPQVDKLLELEIEDCVESLKKMFPKWDEMPDNARAVLIDMRFNLGSAGLSSFVNTMKAFKDGDWKKAADGIAKSKYATQVGKRADRNIKLLLDIK